MAQAVGISSGFTHSVHWTNPKTWECAECRDGKTHFSRHFPNFFPKFSTCVFRLCRYVQIATARWQPMIPRPKIQHVWPPDRRSRRGLRKRRGCKTCLPGGDENTSGFEPLWSLNFIDLVSMIKVSTLSQHAPQEDSNELFEFTSRMHRGQATFTKREVNRVNHPNH